LHINDHEIHEDVRAPNFHQETLHNFFRMSDRRVYMLYCCQSRRESRISQFFEHGLRHEVNTRTMITKSFLDFTTVDGAWNYQIIGVLIVNNC
jgi:hypothetical protein